MFIREDYFEQNGFICLYKRLVSSSSDAGLIELLDDQDALNAGVLYLAPEKNAMAFFEERDVKISFGTLLVVTDAEQREAVWPANLNIIALTEKLPRVFNRLNQLIDAPAPEESVKKFAAVWDKIINQQNIKTAQIAEELSKIENTTGPFARICCVSFEETEQSLRSYIFILKQLLSVIPNSCGTVYGQELIILQTYEERKYDVDFDTEAVTDILEKYKGFMMVGNGTRDLSSLRFLYGLLTRTLEITRLLNVVPSRLFHFERFAMYLVIDYCNRNMEGDNGINYILCLAHPGVVVLTRHDKENNDNLRDVLYFYLMNGRSVSATAEKLYLHRNTIMNKIKRIQKMLNVDLEDRHVRQRLIFSCQVLRYFEVMRIAEDDIPKT